MVRSSKRVADATIRLFGVLSILDFGFQPQLACGYVLVAFPIGLVLLFLGRWQWRRWLLTQRTHGRFAHHVVVVDEREKSALSARRSCASPDLASSFSAP